jgi:ABC-type uncharacterized transport system substrate-binding protein
MEIKTRSGSRVRAFLLKLAFALAVAPPVCTLADSATAPVPTIAIVTSSAVEAYQEALKGLRQELGNEQILVVVNVDQAADSLSATLVTLDPKLIVAIGSVATRATAQAASGTPFIVTMVVQSQRGNSLAGPGSRQAIGMVSLDLAFETVLREIGNLFPDRKRIGIIYSKASSGLDEPSLRSEAERQGFSLNAVNCRGPEDVVEALVSLKHKVDVVWCPPDGSLFNATTVKPLILASLRHQMVITGFSEGFARAGTAAGIYPDYKAVGRQTGFAVRKFLRDGLSPGTQTASDPQVAVNERILRLLGVQWTSPAEPHSRLTVLK